MVELVEIIANPNDVLLNRVKEGAIFWKLEAGILYAVIDKNKVSGLRGIIVMHELPKDVKGLASIIKKYDNYSIRLVGIAIVADKKKVGKIIGRGGWKVKALSEYLGRIPIKVVGDEP